MELLPHSDACGGRRACMCAQEASGCRVKGGRPWWARGCCAGSVCEGEPRQPSVPASKLWRGSAYGQYNVWTRLVVALSTIRTLVVQSPPPDSGVSVSPEHPRPSL